MYALFTYIGDLDKPSSPFQCLCGAQRHPMLFAFLNVWRFVPVVLLAVLALLALLFLYVMVLKR